MHTGLELDVCLTPRLRARTWRIRDDRAPDRPATASPAVEVAWARRGALSYLVGRRWLDVPSGQVMVVPAHVEHVTRVARSTWATSLHVDASLVVEMAELVGGRPRGPEIGLLPAAPFEALGSVLVDEARAPRPGSFLTAEALTEAVAVQLGRAATDDRSHAACSDRRIQAALERIEEGYHEPLTVDDL